jgi:hypothetical protein
VQDHELVSHEEKAEKHKSIDRPVPPPKPKGLHVQSNLDRLKQRTASVQDHELVSHEEKAEKHKSLDRRSSS